MTSALSSTGIVGVWAFVRNSGEPASTDKKIKIILDKHWMFSQPDPINTGTPNRKEYTYNENGLPITKKDVSTGAVLRVKHLRKA